MCRLLCLHIMILSLTSQSTMSPLKILPVLGNEMMKIFLEVNFFSFESLPDDMTGDHPLATPNPAV